MNEAAWVALGVAATLLTGLIMHRLGIIQISLMREAHELNVTRAMPKIGVALKIDKRQENPPAFPPFYYLIATIYNEGEFPAQKLNGKCRLFSPIKEIKEQIIPISRDFLGTTPYYLESQRILGTTLDAAIRGDQTIQIHVEIDFDYFGIPDNKTQHYHADYKYDKQSGQFLKM